jgi:hypothetical protein
MNKIIFTANAEPISDFDIPGDLEYLLDLLENGDGAIRTCNMLMINALRSRLHTTHRHLIDKTQWYYENELVDMDHNLRSNALWRYDNTCLEEEYITVLLKPHYEL